MKRLLSVFLAVLMILSSVTVFADESDGGVISVAEFLLIINQAEHYSQIMEAVETYGEVAFISGTQSWYTTYCQVRILP